MFSIRSEQGFSEKHLWCVKTRKKRFHHFTNGSIETLNSNQNFGTIMK